MGWRQAIALAAACGQLAAAELHLGWKEVHRTISGKTVTVVTRDGQRMQGKVLDRGADTVAVETRGSTTLLRRDAVSTIEVAPRGGKLRGVLVGLGVAVAGSAVVAVFSGMQAAQGAPRNPTDKQIKTAAIAVGVFSVGVGTAAGIYEGRKQANKEPMVIHVIP